MKPLNGKIAVVAGAARGAGRGVARMLGEAGATVYCTGRSSRSKPNTSNHHYAGRPETIEETSELVGAAGGVGIPARVDHSDEGEVSALFERIGREHKGLDILVNVLTGSPVASWEPFWKLGIEEGRAQVDGWVWPHIITCRHAVPLMLRSRESGKPGRKRPPERTTGTPTGTGLIVEIIEQEGIGHHGSFFFDLFEICLKRLAWTLAEELAPHNIAALSITPGFMRTEAILEGFGVKESNWRDAAEDPKAKGYGWVHSETPCFVGRAIAALAADPRLLAKSGGIYTSQGLAREYGFTDLDGSRPDMRKYMEEHHPHLVNAKGKAPFQWKVVG
ncbi:MAG: SDR family NAD(P)-dependent oxidoreductase, partial [Phycisphaerales bacterium]